MMGKPQMYAGVFLCIFEGFAVCFLGVLSCGRDSDTVKCTGTCGGKCVDLQSEPLHCGACGTHCATGQSCISGVCK